MSHSTVLDPTLQPPGRDPSGAHCNPTTPAERLKTFAANDSWFVTHYSELVEQYEEAFVAVLEEKVLASAPGLAELERSLPRDCDRGLVFIGRVTRDEAVELV